MCNILGFNFTTHSNSHFEVASHRGPDYTGKKVYDNRFTLGHNRLSIIDPDERSHQPFESPDGRYVIVFNGEVYNYKRIRNQLKDKYEFRTDSDTEVVLYNYIEKKEECLVDFIGMFAFAIYDTKNDEIFCARDRLGIKPFNYYAENGKFIFASETKVILDILNTRPDVNKESVSQYLRYLYIPFPNTMYQNVKKLAPGHMLFYKDNKLTIKKYWEVCDFIGLNNKLQKKEILEELDRLLDDAVTIRMIADVELGSFLSGGIDSSLILYYMSINSDKPINTFTLGFDDSRKYDERSDAQLMANHFSTNHREIPIEPNIVELLPKMVRHFDEPFGNPTSLLIHELTKEAKKYATVALAGDGGDEVFGGYPRYEACLLYNKINFIPKFAFRFVALLINIFPSGKEDNHTYRRLKVFVNSLSKSEDEMYEDWVGYFTYKEITTLLKEIHSYKQVVKEAYNNVEGKDMLMKTSITDLQTFLTNNLLSYGDAMSMANAFEVRFPLIDHRIVEFMTSISTSFRINKGKTKYILKELLEDKIPDAIINKPKWGLNPPMNLWLKNDLKPLMDDYLSEKSIKNRGWMNYSAVQKTINEHLNNKTDRSLHLWSLITLEEWFRQNEN